MQEELDRNPADLLSKELDRLQAPYPTSLLKFATVSINFRPNKLAPHFISLFSFSF